MKKRIFFIVAVIVLLVITPQLFAQYNRDAVVSRMRDNVRLLGEINAALDAEDFYTAGLKLMEMAEGHHQLAQMSPPRGPQAEWMRIHNELSAAAFRVIGACGEEDAAKVQAEMGEIIALRNEGHGTFRQ
jgi:hypothetical protein